MVLTRGPGWNTNKEMWSWGRGCGWVPWSRVIKCGCGCTGAWSEAWWTCAQAPGLHGPILPGRGMLRQLLPLTGSQPQAWAPSSSPSYLLRWFAPVGALLISRSAVKQWWVGRSTPGIANSYLHSPSPLLPRSTPPGQCSLNLPISMGIQLSHIGPPRCWRGRAVFTL